MKHLPPRSQCRPRRGRFIRTAIFCIAVVCLLSISLQYIFVRDQPHSDELPATRGTLSPEFARMNGSWVLERKRLGHDLGGVQESKCVLHDMNPFNPKVMVHYKKENPITCRTELTDWVYTADGHFHISRAARDQHGNITCKYIPIVRESDFDVKEGTPIDPMKDGTLLTSDFFKVDCKSSKNVYYTNMHAGVARREDVFKRLESFKKERKHSTKDSAELSEPDGLPRELQNLNLSVFMFGFDSVSRMSWMRNLPRTRDYFVNKMGGVELDGYNILGDGTPAALLPIFTGHTELELPEARRGHDGATTVDGHPWVWKNVTSRGYVTAHAEDEPGAGTFQYRMLGFKNPPTDHYMRPFYLATVPTYKNHLPLCLGSVPRHVTMMNWFRELFTVYREFPKFFFGFHTELSHSHFNKPQLLDEDTLLFLKDLEKDGHLDNTLLILMADHGARFNNIRAIQQGKLEERNPYFALRFPPDFLSRYPAIGRNLKINSRRLTTPFDVHATFMDLISFSRGGEGPVLSAIKVNSPATAGAEQSGKIGLRRGMSFLEEIPKERACSDAGVTPHWCACIDWQPVRQSDDRVVSAVLTVLEAINSITKDKRDMCADLKVKEITRGLRFVPTDSDISEEKRNRDFSNSEPMKVGLLKDAFLPPLLASRRELYQVSFITEPGQGHFEVTCTLDVASGKFSINPAEISRINEYGSAPDCLMRKFPQMNPYCYCK